MTICHIDFIILNYWKKVKCDLVMTKQKKTVMMKQKKNGNDETKEKSIVIFFFLWYAIIKYEQYAIIGYEALGCNGIG